MISLLLNRVLSGMLLPALVMFSTAGQLNAMENPVFTPFNEAIAFDKFSADNVMQAKDETIRNMEAGLESIFQIPDNQRTFQNTMMAFDSLSDELNTVWSIVYLMAYTHSDDAIRNACNEVNVEFEKYNNTLAMNKSLYNAVKVYSETEEAGSLTGYRRKYLDETLRDFRRNGFGLPEKKRKELKVLKDEISDILSCR